METIAKYFNSKIILNMETVSFAIQGSWNITDQDLIDMEIDPNKMFGELTIFEIREICKFLEITESEFIDYTC